MNTDAIGSRLISSLGHEIASAILALLAANRDGMTWSDICRRLEIGPPSAFYPAVEAVMDAILRDGVLVEVDDDRVYRLTADGTEAAMLLSLSGELPDVEAREVAAV